MGGKSLFQRLARTSPAAPSPDEVETAASPFAMAPTHSVLAARMPYPSKADTLEARLIEIEQIGERGLDQIRAHLPVLSFEDRLFRTTVMLDRADARIARLGQLDEDSRLLGQRECSLMLMMAERLLPRTSEGKPDLALNNALHKSLCELQMSGLTHEYDRVVVREVLVNLDQPAWQGQAVPAAGQVRQANKNEP